MAVPRKRRRVAPQESISDSENGEPEINQDMETIQIDFDVCVPEPSDFHGIKNLLQQLFQKAHVNVSELADLLIEQTCVTCVVKQALEPDNMDEDDMDEDDIDIDFGVFSVINITEKKEMECIKQIRSYLLDHCKEVCSDSQYEMFQNILDDDSKHVGLLISERFINIPAKVSVPLYHSLVNDLHKANEENKAFDFAYYLLISKTVTFPNSSENSIYLNPEEELIAEEAEFSFEFDVLNENESGVSGKWTDEDDEGLPKRKVMLLPASKYDTVCLNLVGEFGADLL